jgi:hypothetical protein
LGFRGCGKTRVHGGCGKGMTSVVPLNRAESVALQRLRFAVRPLAEFFRSLFSRAIKPSLKRGIGLLRAASLGVATSFGKS